MKNYIKFKKCIDELIPDDKYFGMPKASKIINMKSLFLIFKKKKCQLIKRILSNYFQMKF